MTSAAKNSMRCFTGLAAAGVLLCLASGIGAAAGAAGAVAGAAADTTVGATAGRTRVTYLAGASVYTEAGRLAGLAEGDTLDVLRGGRRVCRLRVRDVSANRAACDTLQVERFPQVGDEVRFAPHAGGGPTPASPAPAPASPAPPPVPGAGGRLHGHAGGHFLTVSPGGAGGYSQPALDLRLDATRLGGSPLDVSVDVRGHRTYYSGGATPDYSRTRVYRLAASLHDAPGHARLTVGRQTSPSLAALSLFDGALAQYGRERWGAGVFAGAEPDPASYGLSGNLIDGGGYFELRSRPLAAQRWTLATGFISSFDRGHPNRDFFFVQGFWSNRKLWTSLSQEIDLNSSWKQALGDPAVSLTSTFLTARYQATRSLDLNAGYDDRRDVRLYRDQVTPETEFDDHHRRGGWMGASVDAGRHLRVGAEGRLSDGGTWGKSWSLTGSLEARQLTRLGVDLRLRTTRTTGDVTDGWLHSGGLTFHPYRQSALELSGGVRTTRDVLSGISSRVAWEGAGLDVPLAQRWYLLLSVEHDHGDLPGQLQSYSSVSWLF